MKGHRNYEKERGASQGPHSDSGLGFWSEVNSILLTRELRKTNEEEDLGSSQGLVHRRYSGNGNSALPSSNALAHRHTWKQKH